MYGGLDYMSMGLRSISFFNMKLTFDISPPAAGAGFTNVWFRLLNSRNWWLLHCEVSFSITKDKQYFYSFAVEIQILIVLITIRDNSIYLFRVTNSEKSCFFNAALYGQVKCKTGETK